MAIGAVVAGASALIKPISQMIAGAKQKKWAKNLKESKYIPQELMDSMNLTKQGAYSNRSFNQGVDEANLRKGTAGTRYAASQSSGSSAQKLAGVAASETSYLNRLKALREKGRNERLDRVDKYTDASRDVASVKLVNRRRYEAAKSALLGASMQNIYGGIGSMGNAIGDIAGMADAGEFDEFGQKIGNIFKKKNKGTGSGGGMLDPNLGVGSDSNNINVPTNTID
jgi:hypothetical protein